MYYITVVVAVKSGRCAERLYDSFAMVVFRTEKVLRERKKLRFLVIIYKEFGRVLLCEEASINYYLTIFLGCSQLK